MFIPIPPCPYERVPEVGIPLHRVPDFFPAAIVQVGLILAGRIPDFQPPGGPPADFDDAECLVHVFALVGGFLARQQVKMAVPAALLDRCQPGFHPLEVFAAPGQMAFPARAVPRPPPIAAAARTGALWINVLRDAIKEGGEAIGVADARSERLPVCVVNAADVALPDIQLVGARLALVQGEARIMSRARGSLAHFSAVECGPVRGVSRPMSPSRGRRCAGIFLRVSVMEVGGGRGRSIINQYFPHMRHLI